MSLLRRRSKPVLALIAFAAIALVVSACANFKYGSLQLSQPAGIGSVRVHFALCTEFESLTEGETPACHPSEETEETQDIVGIAIPKGAVAPATITATPTAGGGAPIVFTRNDGAVAELTAGTSATGEAWPPAGTEGIAYISNPIAETEGVLREWSFDAEFGLPAGVAGTPFATSIAFGIREIGGSDGAPDRPLDCITGPEDVSEGAAFYEVTETAQIGTSALAIAVPAEAAAYVGGKGTIAFPFDFISTATEPPSFKLAASSTLAGASLVLSEPSFVPGALDPTTHRAPAVSRTVSVTVPKNAKPGVYNVTLTATTPQGGSVSQVGQLKVTKPKISLGGVKLNKAKGTATLSVKIPGAGTVTASGKGIVKAKKSAKKATKTKTLKLTIRAKGKAKNLLAEEGMAKVSAKVTFQPLSGAPVTKTKKIILKKNPGPGAS